MEDLNDSTPGISPDQLETLRCCRFVRRVFASRPSLRSVRRPSRDGTENEPRFAIWHPFDGRPFDPEKFEVVEGGWDHEHCHVCSDKISPGDEYWKNEGPDHVDLCPSCFELAQAQLSGSPPADPR